MNEDDIRRLADRLAMLVSTDGEADNAGRAIGQLARNLAMTGGQLKELLIAGAKATVTEGRLKRLEREAAMLRQGLTETQARCEAVEAEREALVRDAEALQIQLRASRGRRRRGTALAVVVALVIGAAATDGMLTTAGTAHGPTPASSPAVRMAVVRAGHVTVFATPDPAGKVLTSFPAGTSLRVHNMVWNQLIQWAEIEMGDQLGYVRSTDVDLS